MMGLPVLESGLALVVAAVYLVVARTIAVREVGDPEARQANWAFVSFWAGLAALALLDGLRDLLGFLGVVDLDVHVALRFLRMPLIVGLLAGLVYYLAYVHTGDRRWLRRIVVAHALLFVFYTYLLVWLHPVAVQVEGGHVLLVDEREIDGPLLWFVLGTLLAPTLFATGAYLSLAFRTQDENVRRRVGLVSSAFLLWFGITLVAGVLDAAERFPAWPLVAKGLGLLAALMVLAAYRPSRRAMPA